MEFSEKLQGLRKSRGLTQEELAQAIYVSRTAVSKWESGRGCPSIDSLKAISLFFSVSVDDLISAERIADIAKKENSSNIRAVCALLFGAVDLLSSTLMILPLYPEQADSAVSSVSLFAYSQVSAPVLAVHWALYALLFAAGAITVILCLMKREKALSAVAAVSAAVGIVTVIFLALTREPYATVMAFLLLMIKGLLLMRSTKAK